MLSVKPLSCAQSTADYFKDNYYMNENSLEPAGHWWGKGAEALGLLGTVEKEHFTALLEGRLPNGERIGIQRDGQWQHRPGWDLTFSAPKSVSILALIGNDRRLIDLHTKAVQATLSEIEKVAAQARVFKDGQMHYENTHNLIVAQFQHATSRENDPQLHTHNVVLNITQRNDGKFRSLASELGNPKEGTQNQGFLEQVYANKRLWGATYRSYLAYGLTQAGYTIEQTQGHSQFEIVGVPETVIKHFSKRSTQIDSWLEKNGIDGSQAADKAALATRSHKIQITAHEAQVGWLKEAEALGFSLKTHHSHKEKTSLSPEQLQATAQDAVERAILQLSEREAVFSHQSLVAMSIHHGLGMVASHLINTAVQQAIQQGQLHSRHLIQGKSIVPSWTTPAAIELEKQMLTYCERGKGAIRPLCSVEVIQRSSQSQKKTTLNPEQQAAVEMVATTTDRIMGIQGFAGTGKTTLLRQVNQAAKKHRIHTVGLAPSASAAQQLEESTGIPCYTIARFLVDKKLQSKINKRTFLIVDESSMIANREMHQLLELMASSASRMLLVGDKDQLPAIGSGKPFALLLASGMTVAVMKILQRQNDPILRAAVTHTIQGDITQAFACLTQAFTEISNKEQRLTGVADHYLKLSPEERANTLVLIPANEDRHAVNQLIREGLQQQGQISQQQETMTTLVSLQLTRTEHARANFYRPGYVVRFGHENKSLKINKDDYLTVINIDTKKQQLTLQRANGKMLQWSSQPSDKKTKNVVEVYEPQTRALAVGEHIRWTRNDTRQGLCNGDTAIVLVAKSNKIVVRHANGKQMQWNPRDFHQQHWEYNYAKTVHNAQGKTAYRVLSALDSASLLSNLKLFYVALSRASDVIHFFVDDKKALLETLLFTTGEKTSALLSKKTENIAEIFSAAMATTKKSKNARVVSELQTAVDNFTLTSQKNKTINHEGGISSVADSTIQERLFTQKNHGLEL